MPTDRALAELALRMHGELFVGRRDDFIVRPSNTFPRRAKRPLQPKDIEAHLEGRYGVGPYILGPELLGGAGCRYGVLDVDADEPEAVRVAWAWLRERSITALVETSKSKGFHLWLLAEDLVPAADMRRILGNCAEAVRAAVPAVAAQQGNARKDGLVEVFPKHAALAARVLYSGGVQLPLNGSVVGAGRTVLLNPESMSPYLDQAAAMHGAVLHRHPASKISEAAAALPVWPVPVEKPRASRRHKDGALYNDAFERVKAATDLLALVQEVTGQDGRRVGPEVAFLCPLHEEREPSFMVNPSMGLFHCHGCGAAGSAIDFWSKAKDMTIGEALRDLAERAGIELKERKGRDAHKDVHGKGAERSAGPRGPHHRSGTWPDVRDHAGDADSPGQAGELLPARGTTGRHGGAADHDDPLGAASGRQTGHRGGDAGDPAARGHPGIDGPDREAVGDNGNTLPAKNDLSPRPQRDGQPEHVERGGGGAGRHGGANEGGMPDGGGQGGRSKRIASGGKAPDARMERGIGRVQSTRSGEQETAGWAHGQDSAARRPEPNGGQPADDTGSGGEGTGRGAGETAEDRARTRQNGERFRQSDDESKGAGAATGTGAVGAGQGGDGAGKCEEVARSKKPQMFEDDKKGGGNAVCGLAEKTDRRSGGGSEPGAGPGRESASKTSEVDYGNDGTADGETDAATDGRDGDGADAAGVPGDVVRGAAGQRGGEEAVAAPPPGHPAADPGPDEEQPPDGPHPNVPRRPTEDIILEFIRSPEGPRFTFRRKKEAYSERDGRWYSAMDWKQSYDRRVLKQILRESLDVPPGEVRLKVARSVWNLWTVRAFNIEYATLKEQGDMKGVTAGEYADLEKAVRTALTRDLRVAESTSDRIVLRSVISYALGRDHGGWVQVGRSGAWCRPGPRVALEYRFLAAYGGNAMGQFSRKTFARKLREAKIGESGPPPVSGVRMYVIFDDWLRENLDIDVREAADAPEPAVDDVKKRAAGDAEDDDD